MDSLDLEVLKRANNWAQQGKKVYLATVARTFGSAPRPVGSLMTINVDDGLILGSVSGGCIEDDINRRVQAGEWANITKAISLSYGGDKETNQRFQLPCGGKLIITLEPIHPYNWVTEVIERVSKGEVLTRTLKLQDGSHSIQVARNSDTPSFDGFELKTVFGPRYRLLIIGAGQISQALAEFALRADYAVTVCDPRDEYAHTWEVSGAPVVQTMPDDTVIDMQADCHTAIVALTHDPKLDDLALMEALKSSAFYVGALGSRVSQIKRKERLQLFDVTSSEVARLRGPVGLSIGAETPAEIAISIMAEMTLFKRQATLHHDLTWDISEHALANSQACSLNNSSNS